MTSAPAGTAELVISTPVREAIDRYLQNLTTGKYWALAITNDGAEVAVLGCPKIAPSIAGPKCEGNGAGSIDQATINGRAVKACGGTGKCMLLYEGDRKMVDAALTTQ